MGDNLLNHGLHLVHLNGIDDKVLGFEVVFCLCFLETTKRFLYPVVENIRETEQYRCRNITQGKLVHDVAQVDLSVVFTRRYIDITILIDAKIRGSPTINVVEFL